MRDQCEHCLGAKYIFDYWLDKAFKEHNVHMKDIPREIFQHIPVNFFYPCHCNAEIILRAKELGDLCSECSGTTWTLTREGIEYFGGNKRISSFTFNDIEESNCDAFVRCSCETGEQSPKVPKENFLKLKEVLKRFRISVSLPQLGLDI